MRVKANLSHKIIWIFLVITMAVSAVEISSIGQAIDTAGKQRMLSYRILKDYVMLSMESEYKDPKKSMEESLKTFKESEAALVRYVKDTEIQSLFSEVEKNFAVMKMMISNPFKKTEGEEYLRKTIKLKSASHQIVLALQKKSGKKSTEILNKIGGLRAISQKINAIYLLKTMGVTSDFIEKSMKDTMIIFADTLDSLGKAELASAEMQKKLTKMKKIYRFFQVMNESDNYVPTIVSKKSSKMLKYANELTKLYINTIK